MACQNVHGRSSRANLAYHMLLTINPSWFVLFFFLELAIFTYKGINFPYGASSVLASEIILVFILAGLEFVRVFLGYKGNLVEDIKIVAMSLLFSIPSLFGALYILLWETYVLRIDIILSSIQIVFIGLEFIFGIIAIITFLRPAA